MPESSYNKNKATSNGDGSNIATLTDRVTELQKANEEIRAARKAASNLMEDAILSKEALAASEEKYRTLFNSMDEGVVTIELILDDEGRATDWVYLEHNPALGRLTGLSQNIVGKKASDIYQSLEPFWMETFGRVVREGTSERFEYGVAELGNRWFDVYAARVGGAGSRQMVLVYNNITQRKQAEEKQTYLLKLSDAIRSLGDSVAIQEAVTRTAMNFFKANRCYYCEIEGDDAVIYFDAATEGLPSVRGSYPLSSFHLYNAVLEAGKPFVVNDVRTNDSIDASLKQVCIHLQLISFINIPIIKQGKPKGIFCLVQNEVRQWTEAEVQLAMETAERTWDAVERANAEEALRTNEERMRAQKEAFQAAIDGATLSDSLNILCRRAIEETGNNVRTAFYIANKQGTQLHPVWHAGNMPENYLKEVDGFLIGEDSLACGLAVPTGKAVLTADVHEEPMWKPWIYLADKYDYRGCWSFPVKTKDNKAIGTFAMYFHEPREATPGDIALAEVITQTAAVIISSHTAEKNMARAEEAFHTSETQLRALIENLPGAAVFVVNKDLQYVLAEGEALQAAGFISADIVGKTVSEVVPEEIRENYISSYTKALTGIPFNEEHQTHNHTFISRGVPLTNAKGEIYAVLAISYDITDRKKAEQALQQSEERMRVTMESAVDFAIISTNTKGIIEAWNNGAEKIFGFTAAEIIGKPADIIFTEEDQAAGVPGQEMATAREKGSAEDERWHKRKDGSRFYVSGVMRPIRNPELTGYVKIARDTTPQKIIELQKDDFIGIASHELRTPVTSIKAYAELLKETIVQNQDVEETYLVTKLDEQIDRLISLIHSLLDTTKIAEGQLFLTPEKFDLNTLITHKAEELQHTSQKHTFKLMLGDTILVHADTKRIEEVLTNLISNAVKYSPAGGDIIIKTQKKQNLAEVCVKDYGLGIPQNAMDKLFNRFFRVKNTQAETYPGMGLGLYISASIIKKHGGKMWVESRQGEGSTFYFTLPLHELPA